MAPLALRSATRKSDDLNTHTTRTSTRPSPGGNHPNNANIGRKKRRRDSTEKEEISIPVKKASKVNSNPDPPGVVRSALSPGPLSKVTGPKKKSRREPTPPPPSPPPAQKTVNHHEKVVNGIKHELQRLQPNAADLSKADEKRSLRSAEGTRFKSELSLYFPDYDEVIGNEPKEEHILDLETPIIITDNAKPPAKQHASRTNGHVSADYSVKEFPDSLFDDLYKADRVDFSFLETHYNDDAEGDPLSDAYFESIHRKPERAEKTIRNGDKGRAQHEKDSVIRLLDGLHGHDWLKILGVSGITASQKKDYEPARLHFIKGCELILEKFKTWREEEKRRKLKKDRLAEAEAEGDEMAEDDNEDALSDGDPPDYSDVDASAARQLHDEAMRSAPLHATHSDKRGKVVLAHEPEVVEKDFTSFFAKKHMRDAAMGRNRRSTRSAAAWGHPVPEPPAVDFNLPEELRDAGTLRAHARAKRRDRRVSKT